MFQDFSSWFVFDFLALDPQESWVQALAFLLWELPKMLVLLVVVIYVMGWFRALIPTEKVRDYLEGKPQSMQRILAIALGSVTPFCSCSSIPLFIGFLEAGVSVSTTFAFLIASPLINEVAVVMLVSLLGWQVALTYVVAAVIVAYVGSVILQAFRLERYVADYIWQIQRQKSPQIAENITRPGALQRHLWAMEEVKNLLGRLWKWVLLGIGLGALFHGFVPESWVNEHLTQQNNLWSVPLAVLLGIPLYSSATSVIPLIEALLLKGVPLGTSLALMMSIAALSLPELIILRQVIAWQALAYFVGVLALLITALGWLLNLVPMHYFIY